MVIPFKAPLKYEFLNKGRFFAKRDFEPDESTRVIRDLVDKIKECSARYQLLATSHEGHQSSDNGRLEDASVSTEQSSASIRYVPPEGRKKGAVQVNLSFEENRNVSYVASLTSLLETYKP